MSKQVFLVDIQLPLGIIPFTMVTKLFALVLIYNTVQLRHAVENPTKISLQCYVFNHTWSSSSVWFFTQPGVDSGDFLTNDVTEIKSCAKICSIDK